MRALAALGGAATKRRAESEPGYYQRIGRLGALAANPLRKGKPRKRAVKAAAAPKPAPKSAPAPALEPIFADVEAVEVNAWDW